jgi:DegT/DnrJ/EryC1/StrS aminotransferase family
VLRQNDLQDRLCQEFDGAKAVLTPTGTDALELAFLLCRDILGYHEIAASALSCRSSIVAAYRARVRLCWLDLQRDALGFGHKWSAIPAARACLIDHFRGRPEQVPGRVADQAPVIEDCAMSFGASQGGEAVGRRGALVVLSFGLGKAVDAGGGGALIVRDANLVGPVISLSGFHAGAHRNARHLSMPPAQQEAVGRALDAYPELLVRRRGRVARLHGLLGSITDGNGEAAFVFQGHGAKGADSAASEINLYPNPKAQQAAQTAFCAVIAAGLTLYPWSEEVWIPDLQKKGAPCCPEASQFHARAMAVGPEVLSMPDAAFEARMGRLERVLVGSQGFRKIVQ